MRNFEQYTLTTVPLSDYSRLADDWRLLETRAETSFFLSWSWVGTWLESYSPDVDVLSAYFKGELVALCLLCKSSFSSWKHFNSRRLHIHQTGDPKFDQIWTEYNGILCSVRHAFHVQPLVLPYLIERYSGWDELQVGAVTKDVAERLHVSSGLMRLNLWQSPSFGVDLEGLNTRKQTFLDSLSRNTRYQIRRSLKLYNEEGGVHLQFAQTESEAQLFFDEIAPLHLKKWGVKLGESGFANPEFVGFHRNLIRNAFRLKQVDIIKVYCGARVLGYLYNLLYRGRVYFYLSGLVSESDSKLKPGLCAHALSIQHYMDAGYHFYDFMGGQDRYKLSLGKAHEELFHISLQKPCLKFKVESFLRDVKQHFES